jgi:hypothetical protein
MSKAKTTPAALKKELSCAATPTGTSNASAMSTESKLRTRTGIDTANPARAKEGTNMRFSLRLLLE